MFYYMYLQSKYFPLSYCQDGMHMAALEALLSSEWL